MLSAVRHSQTRTFAIGQGHTDATYCSWGEAQRPRTAVVERLKRGELVFSFRHQDTVLLLARGLDPALLLTVQDNVVVQVSRDGQLVDSGCFVADDELTWFRPQGFQSRCQSTLGKLTKEILPSDFETDDHLLFVVHNGMHARARQRHLWGDSRILSARRDIRAAIAQSAGQTHH